MKKQKRVFLTAEQLLSAYTMFKNKNGNSLTELAEAFECNIKTMSNWMRMIELKLEGRRVQAGKRKQVLADTVRLIMAATPVSTNNILNTVSFGQNVIDTFIEDLRQSNTDKRAELQLAIRKLQEAKFWLSEAGI